MMKTSTVKIALLLGVLMAFLAGTAYADTVSATIQVINSDGTSGPSVTIDDAGNVSGDVNAGDTISSFGAGVGVSFSGEIGNSGIFTSTTLGYIENTVNGLPTTNPNESTLVLDVANAGCGPNCPTNSQLVITLTDTGASVPQGAALFSATLGADTSTSPGNNYSDGSNVTVQSSVLIDGTVYSVFGNPNSTTTGAYTNAIGPFSTTALGGIVTTPTLPDTYSITSTAKVTFTGSSDQAAFEVDANVNGCTDGGVDCNNKGALANTPVNTPEPTSLLLLGSSLVGLGLLRMKYRFTL